MECSFRKLYLSVLYLCAAVKMFLMTIELSALENKVKDLTQELALEEKERVDEQKEKTGTKENKNTTE